MLRIAVDRCGDAVTSLIGVCTTRAGQTSTYWAASIARTLAQTRTVLLVDCDMEGGTIADLLYLRLDDRGLANLFGERAATVQQVEAQTVPVPDIATLTVVPGLRHTYGFEISDCLRQIRDALRNHPADAVVVDLGHPLAHPGLRSPRAAGDAVASCFQRLFVVIRDEPSLLARSIDVLRSAHLAHGEVIVCQQRSRAHLQVVQEVFNRELPELALRTCWSWDERKAARMGETGRPMLVAAAVQELSL